MALGQGPIKNRENERYGRLTAIYFAGWKPRGKKKLRHYVLWDCLCDCGNWIVATADELQSGAKRSCGCLQKETRIKNGQKHHIDLTGKTIWEWHVDSRVEDRVDKSGVHAVRYSCTCSCGKKAIVLASSLLANESHDCGHTRQATLSQLLTKDLTGQQFNELTALYKVPNLYPSKWHCKCSCGAEKDIYEGSLVSKDTLSCGHLKMSKGEYAINQLLTSYNLDFKFDCGIKGFKSARNASLRFDFQLFKEEKLNCIIEFQGQQHYEELLWGTKDFGRQQREETDPMKREFCKLNNIPLYEIKFDENIEEKVYYILTNQNLIQDNTVPSMQETA